MAESVWTEIENFNEQIKSRLKDIQGSFPDDTLGNWPLSVALMASEFAEKMYFRGVEDGRRSDNSTGISGFVR